MREVIKEVVCIDGDDYPNKLTNGNTYSVVAANGSCYLIIDDTGKIEGEFFKRRFQDIEPVKNNEFFPIY